MIDKEKAALNPTKQWVKFIVVLVLYLLFLLWVESWWGLLVVPFIFDAYITKENTLAVVERCRGTSPIHNGLGGCFGIRVGCSVLH